MSKGYSDIVALLDYFDKKNSGNSIDVAKLLKTLKKETKTTTPPKIDIYAILNEKRQEAQAIETLLNDIVKIKKEEKKDEPKKGFMKDWTVGQKFCFFALAGPPAGVAYIFGLLLVAKGLAAVVGVHT